MNARPFKYAVLKYRPSYWLDESVNVGLLFVFDGGQVSFIYPKRVQRLVSLYPKTDLTVIRQYLSGFKQHADRLANHRLFLEKTDENWLANEFLVPDANAFFFSELKGGQYTDEAATIEYYKTAYFSVYDGYKPTEHKNEAWISNRFAGLIKTQDASRLPLFQHKIKIETRGTFAEFDYAWKNGTQNLVKPLGFDLQSRESILDKSNLWWAKLTHLRPKLEASNQKIDFLLSAPTADDAALTEAFDEAVYVLEKLELPKQVIQEAGIPKYVQYALENMVAPASSN